MLNIELAIKFGENEITIFQKGLGIVAKEPAYLAVVENNGKFKVKSAGKKAREMYFSSADDITVYEPIDNGEIKNEKFATMLIAEILKPFVAEKAKIGKVSAVVAVPCAMELKQLRTLKRVLKNGGISKVTFVQNAVATRMNCAFDEGDYAMFVDIGKGVTDISVLNDNNFAFGRVYSIGGKTMDDCLTTFILDNANLTVTDETSEAIKNEIASLYERDHNKTTFVGIDTQNKYIKSEIVARDVKLAIVNVYDKIFDLIKTCIESQPLEIKTQLQKTGVVFGGGASSIPGLYEYAKKHLDVPVTVLDMPMDAVILGAGKLLYANKNYLKINL